MDKVYAIALVTAIGVVGGGAFVACSSSSDTGGGGNDSGVHDTGSSGDTGTTTDSGTPSDTGSSGDTGTTEGGVDCGSSPTLHPGDGSVGPFCLGVDAGHSGNCPTGDICCQTPSGSSTASSCIAAGGSCPSVDGGVTWECDEPAMCTGGQKCCGFGSPGPRPGCSYDEIFPPQGSHCASSCATGEFVVCSSTADCPTGQTCTPMKESTKQIGYCK